MGVGVRRDPERRKSSQVFGVSSLSSRPHEIGSIVKGRFGFDSPPLHPGGHNCNTHCDLANFGVRSEISKLSAHDERHLEAATGWLGLGNWNEANEELEKISATERSHPTVLSVRWQVLLAAKKWELAAEVGRAISEAIPDASFGWIHWAYSLHSMKRTQEAWDVLSPVVDKFPNEYLFRYNLACYACQLGDLENGWKWLVAAIDIADDGAVKLEALDDPDLEPLWAKMMEI